ncbi:MAG: cytochrome C [Nitrospirae bacterium]|nr:cytochrome C [Nitrospirota bacterium]
MNKGQKTEGRGQKTEDRGQKTDIRHLSLSFIIILLVFLAHFSDAYPFTTSKEFLAHVKGEKGCATQQCHQQFMKGVKKFGHDPSSSGECGSCHNAEAYPNRYGLELNQSVSCTACHKKVEHDIQADQFVHGPIKNGDCTSCHDPHGSDTPFILKKPYSQLCSTCHSLKGLYAGSFIHKPVEDGNCGICHAPHSSNYKSRLRDTGANLCLSCHEDIMSGMTKEYVHAPLIKNGCIDCHDPHSGNDKSRLKSAPNRICFNCHEEKKTEMDQYTKKHKPAFEGQCTACHSPHFSERKYLLTGEIDTLCYTCHKDNSVWKKRQFQHGPVMQGNCAACHNSHGSDNAFILRLPFPHKFYTAYEKGKYSLCFLCHKEALVTTGKTLTITNFRNGDVNLHWLHVNQEKGRTCRACHDIHASDIEYHLRDEFIFGTSSIPINYSKSATGGSCAPGCHKERRYDRVKMVDNNN